MSPTTLNRGNLCTAAYGNQAGFCISTVVCMGDVDGLPAGFPGVRGTVIGDLVCTVQSVIMNSWGC